jgi:5-methyltetrahydropteroyltriglutamate--homocysteine methyltransferase
VGGFEPLRFLPKNKTVVLGLVTSKDPRLESEDRLLRQIEEASKYVPVEQLAISPQCGFSGSADNAFMTPDEQWKKLELIVRVADRVWGF